jgi:TRAP-type C4-dicarboxylate transport system permease small subunit
MTKPDTTMPARDPAVALLGAAMDLLDRAMRLVAAACLLAIMVIVFFDVGARYLVNAPLSWSYDLIGMYLMPVLFYFTLSDTLADHHHVAVDLLRPKMAPWLARTIEIVGGAAMAAVIFAIASIYLGSASEKFRTNALVLSVGQWPAWIPDAIVVVGAASLGLRLSARAVGHALSLLLGRSLVELPRSEAP